MVASFTINARIFMHSRRSAAWVARRRLALSTHFALDRRDAEGDG